MRWIFAIMVLCACLGLALIASPGRCADEVESLESLRKEKLKAAEQWRDAVRSTKSQDLEAAPEYSHVFEVERALKNARLEIAASRNERLHALRDYHQTLDLAHRKIAALYEAGAKGGEAHLRAQARFYWLEAKVWLKEEEQKP